jgi:hypothetical protein
MLFRHYIGDSRFNSKRMYRKFNNHQLDICVKLSLTSPQLYPNVRHDLGGLPGC